MAIAELTITELINLLQRYQEEVGCDGENIGSHSGTKSRVRFYLTNPELDYSLDLQDIELDLRLGCLCPEGIVFNLRATED